MTLGVYPETTLKEARGKSSVFFFVWTWYERQIRQAILTVLPDGIELYDALYSKKEVNAGILKQAILELTGFKVLSRPDCTDCKNVYTEPNSIKPNPLSLKALMFSEERISAVRPHL